MHLAYLTPCQLCSQLQCLKALIQLPFKLWLYVDDITIHCPVPQLKEIVSCVQDAVTQDLQGSVNCSKSAMHLPCRAGTYKSSNGKTL
jgi:hypothetical protein